MSATNTTVGELLIRETGQTLALNTVVGAIGAGGAWAGRVFFDATLNTSQQLDYSWSVSAHQAFLAIQAFEVTEVK
jgi:hypothetical protein